MKIDRLEIKNFRLLKDISIDLQDNLSLVIGKNNTGKTSFLDILKRFLSDTKPEFSFDDFNIDAQKQIIDYGQADYSPEDFKGVAISLKVYISYNENDNLGNIHDLILDLDGGNNNIVILFEYTIDYEKYKKLKNDFQQYQNKIRNDFSYYISQKMNNYFKIYIRAMEYNNETNSKIISDDIVKAVISLQTIGANRDVDNDLGNKRPLSSLAYKYYKAYDSSDISFPELQSQLMKTDGDLTEYYHNLFKPIVDEIKSMSYNPSEAEIAIISSLSEHKILQDNTTIKYKHDETFLPETYNGLGYLNLFSIIFNIRIKLNILAKKNNQNKKPTPINLLFIEEPEAHTHPQMQYIFIKNIKSLLKKHCEETGDAFSLQSVISTHSSHIVSQCDFDDIKYFFRESSTSIKSRSLNSLYSQIVNSRDESIKAEEERRFRFLKQYITLNHTELFFADKAIFIEGDTERLLLSAMMNKIDKNHLDEQGYLPLLSQNISIVEVGAYAHVFANFIGFLGIKTLIISDLDCSKENKNKRLEKCKFTESKTTTNMSIKSFLNNVDDIHTIVAFTAEQKTLSFNGQEWIVDAKGSLRIAYQCEENGYQARSFEDAFISKNYQFILKNKDEFSSLKCYEKIIKNSDFYDIAENCIDSKTKFALDIIYYGGEQNKNWQIPKYIEEGLEWLQQQ